MSEKNDWKKSLFGKIKDAVDNVSAQSGDVLQSATKTVSSIGKKAGDLVSGSKDMIVNAVDANGNGQVDIEDFIIMGLRTPGIGINRESFLRAELRKDYSKEKIEDAVNNTPAHAGITVEEINKHADQVIAYERNCVTGISTALGMPGGAAMAATIPADMVQYYGFMLRAAQKLLYLYGFPQIDVSEKENVFDSETLNMLTICIGVMFGVAGANQALRAIANALAQGVEKKLLRAALTKGTIYPIVKNIAKWFGQNMTKKVFAGFFKNAIPVIGGVVGGTITFVSFAPCCNKLKSTLQNTVLSNPELQGEETALEQVVISEVDDSYQPAPDN